MSIVICFSEYLDDKYTNNKYLLILVVIFKQLPTSCRHCLHSINLNTALYLTMTSKVTDLPFFLEKRIAINSGCLPMFAPITSKEGKTNIASNGVTPLMTNTKHNTVQKSVLVGMQNNFMGNPYTVDNTRRPLTGNDQMI